MGHLYTISTLAALACAPLGCAPASEPAAPAPTPSVPSPEPSPAPADPTPPKAAEQPRTGQQARGKAVTLEQAPEATRKAFWAAIRAGRKQTTGKDYAAAIASFDAALRALPDHPRALSGRGYARLLAGELDAAEADLRRALAAPGTRELESAIAFNLGLVAEKRGDVALARAHFSLANILRPSKAAAAKLADAPACPVLVEYATPESALYADWIALWRHLRDEGAVEDGPDPKDDATARKIACTSEALRESETATFDACTGSAGPWLVKHYTDFGGHALFVIERADAGQWRMTDLGMAGGGRCGALSDAAITGDNPAIVTWELQEFAPIDVMEDASGQIVDCEGDADCFTACSETTDARFSAFVFSSRTPDPTRIHGPLVDGDHGPPRPLADVRVEGDEIVVAGGGCDLRRPLVAPRP